MARALCLSFLKLEDKLQAAGQRMLESCHGSLAEWFAMQANQRGILVVVNNWYDVLLGRFVRGLVSVFIDLATDPPASRRIDSEPKMLFFLRRS